MPNDTTLSARQVSGVVFTLLVSRGKFPPGTTTRNWTEVLLGDLQIDDPPLFGDPNYEKKRLALELQLQFLDLGADLRSPLATLKKARSTVAELVTFCREKHTKI